MTEEKKKDLIDLVREGKQIEIYESGKELKEGDVVEDWKNELGTEVRLVVGGRTGFTILGKHLFDDVCSYCNTAMHSLIKEAKWYRTGRDGRKYYKYRKETHGKICPLCENTIENYNGYGY